MTNWKFAVGVTALVLLSTPALADPIEGTWKTKSGDTADIAPCGEAYCITLKSGKHVGKQIGKMSGNGDGTYHGSITDPGEDKTYKGKASVDGSSMTLKGCVLAGLICRGETWTKM
jgi:uncharacterized protein (DUF2147 family)